MSSSIRELVADGSGNINLPGSTWNSATREIVFSSSREPHDEVFVISEDGRPGDEIRITDRMDNVAYEPSLSPDGECVVFESHLVDVEDNGIIVKFKLDGTEPYQALTDPNADCRQPNWSPAGDRIVYQRLEAGRWDLWLTDPDGQEHFKLTDRSGDSTDASFSPDGRWVVFSAERPVRDSAELAIISIDGRNEVIVTESEGYDGAPSWSPDGRRVVFESSPGDPDDSGGTTLWTIDVPELSGDGSKRARRRTNTLNADRSEE